MKKPEQESLSQNWTGNRKLTGFMHQTAYYIIAAKSPLSFAWRSEEEHSGAQWSVLTVIERVWEEDCPYPVGRYTTVIMSSEELLYAKVHILHILVPSTWLNLYTDAPQVHCWQLSIVVVVDTLTKRPIVLKMLAYKKRIHNNNNNNNVYCIWPCLCGCVCECMCCAPISFLHFLSFASCFLFLFSPPPSVRLMSCLESCCIFRRVKIQYIRKHESRSYQNESASDKRGLFIPYEH